MIEQILSLSGLLGIFTAIAMIIAPGFVSGMYKTDTPISLLNPTSALSKIFTVGLVVAGLSQSVFALYLLRDFSLRSQRFGLVICVVAGVCCAGLAVFRDSTHPNLHAYLAKAYFCFALFGSLCFQIGIQLEGIHTGIGSLIVSINIVGILYIFVRRGSKFWAEIWGISFILLWYFQFYLRG